MDLSRLSRSEQIAAGSGLLLFVFMFFKWFGVSVDVGFGGVGASANAWDTLEVIRFVLLLAVIAAVGFPLLKASGNELDIPVPPATIITLLGGLSVLLILFRIISPPGLGVDFDGISVGREVGVFLGLLAAIGITYGGYASMQEEGVTFQDAADQFSNPGPGGGGTPGAPGGQAPPVGNQAPPPGGQAPPPGGQAPPVGGQAPPSQPPPPVQ